MVAGSSHVVSISQCLWMQYVLAESGTLDGVPCGVPFGPCGRLRHGGVSSSPGGGEDEGSIGFTGADP